MVHRSPHTDGRRCGIERFRDLEASYSNATSMEWRNIQADAELELQENTD
jgi:hypothetical protein